MNNIVTITPINEDFKIQKNRKKYIRKLKDTIITKKIMLNIDMEKIDYYQTKQINNTFEKLSKIENKLLEYEDRINKLMLKLQNNNEDKFKKKIFYKGQTWDSYELVIDIIKSAQNKIIIIDNYIDDTILKMLKKKNYNVNVKIITSNYCKISKLDINKFNTQYPYLKIIKTNKFHDRFLIIDGKELYHCGASIKDLGTKCFAINKIDEANFIKKVEKSYNL